MEIKKTLQAHGYTVQAAADRMGVDRVTLSRTISGNPTVKTLRRLSDATGIPFIEFFADELPPSVGGSSVAGCVCPYCGHPVDIVLR